jgi:hypothetical protein
MYAGFEWRKPRMPLRRWPIGASMGSGSHLRPPNPRNVRTRRSVARKSVGVTNLSSEPSSRRITIVARSAASATRASSRTFLRAHGAQRSPAFSTRFAGPMHAGHLGRVLDRAFVFFAVTVMLAADPGTRRYNSHVLPSSAGARILGHPRNTKPRGASRLSFSMQRSSSTQHSSRGRGLVVEVA